MLPWTILHNQASDHPYPLLFATISGAHLYGFPSPDSDFDLRGAHILPLKEVVGLKSGPATVERMGVREGLEMDLVTHDVAKFFGLMLKRNGYVLEQILSPLVVFTSPEHETLKAIARKCVTRHHAFHYLGFADTQLKLFVKEDPPRVKPLLYTYRVLLSGIHLMRTGEVEPNLVRLNEEAKLPYIDDLTAMKLAGAEHGTLNAPDVPFHRGEVERLRDCLLEAKDASALPEMAAGVTEQLNELLIKIRLQAAE